MVTQHFSFGEVVATSSVAEELEITDIMQLLRWHGTMKQGLLCNEDWERNKYALNHQERIFSAYEIRGQKYYVITEWDRSCTTILGPEDY